jgi:hypothetical protein
MPSPAAFTIRAIRVVAHGGMSRDDTYETNIMVPNIRDVQDTDHPHWGDDACAKITLNDGASITVVHTAKSVLTAMGAEMIVRAM